MVHLPRTCGHCGRHLYHYAACECPDAQLVEIDRERRMLNDRLKRLDEREREVLGLVSESASRKEG